MRLPLWWSSLFKDLELLAGTLARVKATADLSVGLESGIRRARQRVEDCKTDPISGRRYREIALRDLPIVAPTAKQLHPSGTELGDATLGILYSCYDEIDQSRSFGYEEIDRIHRTDFQVKITGVAAYGEVCVDLEDHWRVDTHYFSGDSNEPHPLFHFQRGGYAQDAFADSPGFLPGDALLQATLASPPRALMQTACPRIALPPMDPVCAIDFVIGQHNGGVRSSLWALPEYAARVRSAQDRLWAPYFDLLKDESHRRRLMPFFGAPLPRAL